MSNTHNTSITLDCALHNFEQFAAYLKALNITFKILSWHGPAGGNPSIEFYGSHEALSIFTQDYYNNNI
jgi:hypothetical protein